MGVRTCRVHTGLRAHSCVHVGRWARGLSRTTGKTLRIHSFEAEPIRSDRVSATSIRLYVSYVGQDMAETSQERWAI